MRQTTNINKGWQFSKCVNDISDMKLGQFMPVDLPHTWNAVDGTDGGNDYYRGECWYVKILDVHCLPEQQVFLECNGANSSAEVYVNGRFVAKHDGGYSRFRANITAFLSDSNIVAVKVDNRPGNSIYPQCADFTFYGGLYRDVNLIVVDEAHFDLSYYGSNGIKITPILTDNTATVTVESFAVGNYDEIRVTVDGQTLSGKSVTFTLNHPHLWNGVNDPFLYIATAHLVKGEKIVDAVTCNFGIRQFHVDAQEGFFLNGKSYPLRGVAKHQDFAGVGNAVTKEMMELDMALMLETGANTIRLAHYQHDQYVYDLCDRYGLCVWTEIPYISQHLSDGNDNTISQMTELILQNYNHPSIVCWGLSNEITICGESNDIVKNHIVLNDLCHRLDSLRPTAMACVSTLDSTNPLLDIPDILSYNLYFGWYVGKTSDNAPWFDKFHKQRPTTCIGLSEYGAESMPNLHNSNPTRGDYTEEYQTWYHEQLLKTIAERPYIWATHMWNMFDFGADGRKEGGEPGRNHKGLVTFDRKTRKDSFYIYKAYFSPYPFVHICGKRYINRTEDITVVKVYSNQPQVSLYNNGSLIETKNGDKIFTFEVKLEDDNDIVATSGSLKDNIVLKKVEVADPDYRLKEEDIINWFTDIEEEST
jgi:beta-galactosidase